MTASYTWWKRQRHQEQSNKSDRLCHRYGRVSRGLTSVYQIYEGSVDALVSRARAGADVRAKFSETARAQ